MTNQYYYFQPITELNHFELTKIKQKFKILILTLMKNTC